MTLTNINDYIALKATLVSQIAADASIVDITNTIDDIVALKATISSTYSTQNLLDDSSGTSTADRIKWIVQVLYATGNDGQLNDIIQTSITKCDTDINADDGSNLTTLYARKASLLSLLLSTMSTTRLAFFSTMVNNL